MERNVYDILLERGFIGQVTHEEEIKELLSKEKVTFYIGFDPTADSLTAGHFLQLMAMAHMQRAGHRPLVLIGAGTTLIGDPTGKSDMRKMLTLDEINANGERFKEQISKFIDFSDGKAIMANNADWLTKLNYIEFLRDVGVHFSVNRMLTADSYKTRMERGLTLLEFNYMPMQSYDFLVLFREYGCNLQMGGTDQWSNILGGVDLIRKLERKPAFGVTFNLLTTSDGRKMGKSEKGAVWLDPEKTSPYEFFQYWRNVEDVKVGEILGLLTFLPMDEVRRLSAFEGSELNKAKEVLAFEITKIVHGEEEAMKALEASKALFGGEGTHDDAPFTEHDSSFIGMDISTVMTEVGLVKSKGEARRLIQQNGVSLNGEKVADPARPFAKEDFSEGYAMIKKGKKVYHKLVIK